MIIHCVLLSLRPDADIAPALALLTGLHPELPGMLAITHGPNRDYEGKSVGYTYGIVITFADRASLAAYDAHPEHKRAGAMLVAGCLGGAEGIFVADIDG